MLADSLFLNGDGNMGYSREELDVVVDTDTTDMDFDDGDIPFYAVPNQSFLMSMF